MDIVINDFVQLLRRHGLRVSPAESLDALRALWLVGLGERELVRDTLRATLVKSGEDAETFERLFELFFGLGCEPAPPRLPPLAEHEHEHGAISGLELGEDLDGPSIDESHAHSHEGPEAVPMRQFFDEQALRPAASMHGDPERLRLSLFAQELVLNRSQGTLDQILRKITHQLRVRRARNIFNPGGLAPLSDSQELPIDIAASELQELVDQLAELEVDEALIDQLLAQADSIVQGLPELLKAMLERRRQLATSVPDIASTQERSLRRMLDFAPNEQREMEAAIRRLARQIHGATTRRRRQDRLGRISVAHTLRHNLRYDGVPFQPVLRRRHEQRPRLVLLCDVSLSTRNLSRFWLHLIHQMQSLFSKVRAFVFVADLVEVTHLFEDSSIDRAVAAIFGGKLLDVDTNSDFGRAAEQFREQFLQVVNRRSTVVILGDGRNNGRPPNEAALEAIVRHARQTFWLTPEPRWGWSLGSCDMQRYAALCQRVEVVRTVQHLAGVAENLVQGRSA
jgi:hypothetical protein